MHYKPADDRVWDTTKLNIEVSIYISIIMIDKIMFIMNGDRYDDDDDCAADNFFWMLVIFHTASALILRMLGSHCKCSSTLDGWHH